MRKKTIIFKSMGINHFFILFDFSSAFFCCCRCCVLICNFTLEKNISYVLQVYSVLFYLVVVIVYDHNDDDVYQHLPILL